eukprot:scaffold495_cov243-Pinguiococcus_pyrenoidosus.AAC.20
MEMRGHDLVAQHRIFFQFLLDHLEPCLEGNEVQLERRCAQLEAVRILTVLKLCIFSYVGKDYHGRRNFFGRAPCQRARFVEDELLQPEQILLAGDDKPGVLLHAGSERTQPEPGQKR